MQQICFTHVCDLTEWGLDKFMCILQKRYGINFQLISAKQKCRNRFETYSYTIGSKTSQLKSLFLILPIVIVYTNILKLSMNRDM